MRNRELGLALTLACALAMPRAARADDAQAPKPPPDEKAHKQETIDVTAAGRLDQASTASSHRSARALLEVGF